MTSHSGIPRCVIALNRMSQGTRSKALSRSTKLKIVFLSQAICFSWSCWRTASRQWAPTYLLPSPSPSSPTSGSIGFESLQCTALAFMKISYLVHVPVLWNRFLCNNSTHEARQVKDANFPRALIISATMPEEQGPLHCFILHTASATVLSVIKFEGLR